MSRKEILKISQSGASWIIQVRILFKVLNCFRIGGQKETCIMKSTKVQTLGVPTHAQPYPRCINNIHVTRDGDVENKSIREVKKDECSESVACCLLHSFIDW